MTGRDILQQRLINQQLAGSAFTKPHELVNYMGCIQAQDFYGAKWAIGTRIKGITDAAVEKEFNEGKIIRIHILRPTWHFVSPDDIGWMLQLTAPQIKMLSAGYLRKEGIDTATLNQSKKTFEDALTGGKQLTRDELVPLLKARNIKTNDNHLSLLLLEAELDGLICSGPRKGKQFTYALLHERVPKPKLLDGDEALAELAKRYFISRGPATVQDFAWWSGLNITRARRGLEIIKPALAQEAINGQVYWFVPVEAAKPVNSVQLLPAYDEFNVAYKNRSLSIPDKHKALSGSGIFKPPLLINGQIAGTWKRTEKKDKVLIAVDAFIKLSKQSVKDIAAAAGCYGKFLGKQSDLKPIAIIS